MFTRGSNHCDWYQAIIRLPERRAPRQYITYNTSIKSGTIIFCDDFRGQRHGDKGRTSSHPSFPALP